MQSLTRRSTQIKIKFRTEKDRTKGVYEMFDSGIRSGSVGNKQYVITPELLASLDSKDIKYDIIE